MTKSERGSHTNWAEKTRIARESFKEVLSSDEHEDGKAQRILTAMAFLAAAAGLIFAEFGRAKIASELQFPYIEHAYVPTSFFAFVVALVIGTLFFLAALGPAFNLPRPFRSKDEKPYPKSLLFSQWILEGTPEEWEKHWEKTCVQNGVNP